VPLDIVVDTNVFMHAGNPTAVSFFGASKTFLENLKNSQTLLCFDKPNAGAEDRQGDSLIYGEYIQRIVPGVYGFNVLAALALNQKIKFVSRDVGPARNRMVIELIPGNKRDRTFLRTTMNSADRILITNDFDDFTPEIRKRIKRQLTTTVKDATVRWTSL